MADMTQGRLRVTIVEDDPEYRDILREWLAPQFDTTCLPHGEELLESPDELAPDVIIMDIGLPGPDGLVLCRRLRRLPRFARTPIVFLTGTWSEEVFLSSIESGGDAFLTKPVARKALLHALRRAVEAKEAPVRG